MHKTRSEKRDIPAEYFKWVQYEVVIPLVAPVMVFLILFLFVFKQDKSWGQAASDALLAVAGTGDLLIFGALLLINVASTLLFEKDATKGDCLTISSSHAHKTLTIGLGLLFIYGMVRTLCYASSKFAGSSMQFLFGIISSVILLCAVLWADKVVSEMHLRRIRTRLDQGKLVAQYNID